MISANSFVKLGGFWRSSLGELSRSPRRIISVISANSSLDLGEFSQVEWARIRTRGLMTGSECAALNAYAGFKPFLPVKWSLQEVITV